MEDLSGGVQCSRHRSSAHLTSIAVAADVVFVVGGGAAAPSPHCRLLCHGASQEVDGSNLEAWEKAHHDLLTSQVGTLRFFVRENSKRR